jgi:hypothetical protein
MACLNLTELRDLGGAEKGFLEDAAKKIEMVVENTKMSALMADLDQELMQKGLVSTLIITTASLAALSANSEDKEALAFAVMRCMAEALFDVLAFPGRDSLGKRH